MLDVGVGVGGVVCVLLALGKDDVVGGWMNRRIRCLVEELLAMRSVVGRLRGMLEGLENSIESKL